ncbi:RNA recognition motif 2-domain-containing protein [Coniochaeta sp. 2T2.1]|nr:RNA recognition motif 2-domain-containing protein [Coniochaeta sp. 2T2.1]
MSQPRETGFNPSSPHSSTGHADSYKNEGTPDTRLTAFSPEDGSAKSSKYHSSLSLPASDSQSVRFPGKPTAGFRPSVTQADKDPFTASTTSQSAIKRNQRLSPLASDFQPFGPTFGYSQAATLSPPGTDDVFDTGRTFSPGNGNGDLQTDTTAEFTRYVVLSSCAGRPVTPADVNALFSRLESFGNHFKGKRFVHGSGTKVYVRFTNRHDAYMVWANARHGGLDWRVDFVRPAFWQVLDPAANADSATEGQVMLVIDIRNDCRSNASEMELYVYRLLAAEAEIFTFVKQGNSSLVLMRVLVEFYDFDAASTVIDKYNGFAPPGEGFTLHLSPYKHAAGSPHAERSRGQQGLPLRRNSVSDITSTFQNMSMVNPPQLTGNVVASGRPSFMGMPLAPSVGMYPHALMYHNQPPASPHYVLDSFASHSPAPYHVANNMTAYQPLYQTGSLGPLVPYQPGYSTPKTLGFLHPDMRRQNAQRISRAPHFNAASNHNHVETSRIRDGIDVRTTIMLRNIPNKVDQAMLKSIVDESSWGKYDFMYLRIDFANDCNVGYAFINFVDPLDIIDFVQARDHQRWNCFKSDKVAEISYATIQGKDCLVQKFRNSSVMLEPPHYRPKLYYTLNGPNSDLAGEEEPFPGPDNQSKMKRSCENAEHVGLFTPNAGQHFRDEQRRRRSQYDRGTRLAALEEYDYDNNFKHFGVQ